MSGEQTKLGIWAKTICNKDPHTVYIPQKECFIITENQTWQILIILWDLLGRFQELGEKKRRTIPDSWANLSPPSPFGEMAYIFLSGSIMLWFPPQLVHTVICLLETESQYLDFLYYLHPLLLLDRPQVRTYWKLGMREVGYNSGHVWHCVCVRTRV